MSYLDNQFKSFNKGISSSAAKISNKRAVAAQTTSSPSPASSSQNLVFNKQDLKRKRPEPTTSAFSQPKDTGTGKHIMTQVAYTIAYLKDKGPQKLEDVFSYLSVQGHSEEYRKALTHILRRHEKIDFDPKGFGGKGSFAFRPIHNIHTGDQLLHHLQSQPTAQGLPVKELLEGWPDVDDVIRSLENEHKLLVIRNKKDDHAKMVWPDDPSLAQHVDHEFMALWHRIKLPDAESITNELEKSGLVPASKDKVVKVKPKVQEKKPKKTRRGGKVTNTHMASILRDYSSMNKK